MSYNEQHSVSYDWGGVTTFTPDLRSNELVLRVRWFINMRWIAAVACFAAAATAQLNLLPVHIVSVYFEAVGLFLCAANTMYTLVARRMLREKSRQHRTTTLLTVQMLADFLSLSILTYACGGIETPIAILFMAHIILATLFFPRWAGLAIMAAAWFFAALPLFLEWAGVLPQLSIFNGQFKSMVLQNTALTAGFVIGTGGVFFVCWYLMSVITASLKLRELQVEEAYRAMVRMDREKTQATLRATHELKAPFAAIKSYVYTLKDGYCGPLPDKAAVVVSKIGDRCDNLMKKITDIIHLSNIKTLVVTDMNLAPVDLVSILTDEIREGVLVAEPRKIVVESLLGTAEPVRILGSARHLKTLFSNLIQNAVSYSDNDTGCVQVSLHQANRRVMVKVTDNGIGIPKENLTKIFEEHFRSKNAVAHNPSGTGLGLSIVKEIVRLHGATIEVESTVGKGTSFTVSFELQASKLEREDHGEHTHN